MVNVKQCDFVGCTRDAQSRGAQYCKSHYDSERIRNRPKVNVVYGLSANDRCFYVGATHTSARKRLINHLWRARSGHPSPVYEYMRTLDPATIVAFEVERLGDADDLPSREAYWIAHYLADGHPIVNERGLDGRANSTSAATARRMSRASRGKATWIKGKHGEAAGWTEERRGAQSKWMRERWAQERTLNE